MGGIYHDGDYYAGANADDDNQLLKDTVGWIGKNLLKNTAESGSYQGITYTVNSDKSITINGTNTDSAQHLVMVGIVTLDAGAYKVNGLKNNGGYTSFWINLYSLTDSSNIIDVKNADEDVTFTLSAPKQVRVNVYWAGNATVSNITIYPMLRKADITDPTYEPYHESVEVMYEEEIHGVNLLPYPYVDSTKTNDFVTFTDNGDGSISLAGTASANPEFRITPDITDNRYKGMILTSQGGSSTASGAYVRVRVGDKSSGSFIREIVGSEIVIPELASNEKYYIALRVTQGTNTSGIRIYPMLRKADIEDSTYRPYNEQAIQNQLNAQGVLGAKNLLKNNATSQTISGVTFTVNADGSVTANGTATANITSYFIDRVFSLKAGKYLISGTPNSIFSVGNNGVRISNDDFSINVYGDEDGTLFTLDNDTSGLKVDIRIASGTTVSNLTFKPMLRLASDPDDTYQPYAMTNRELTEDRCYHAGDTVNVSLMNFAGLITNSSKEIRFTIPLMKDLSKITGITFKSSTTVGIRKPTGGYVIDGTISSGYNITILAKSGNLLSIKLTKTDDSAFDATNNTPLDVAFTGGSNDSVITFN